MKNNDHCDFEFCRDCGLAYLNELLLADIRRLSVVAVVFLYQRTVFLQQNTTTALLELCFNDSIQCKLECTQQRRRWQSTKRSPMWPL